MQLPCFKTFAHGVYGRKLVAANLHNKADQNGYVQQGQNMYNMFDEGNDSSNAATMVTHMAAVATTGSTLGNTYQTAPASTPQEHTTAIDMIVANQQLMYQHIAPLLQ